MLSIFDMPGKCFPRILLPLPPRLVRAPFAGVLTPKWLLRHRAIPSGRIRRPVGLFSMKRIRGRAAGARERDGANRELPGTSPPCPKTLTSILHRVALSHKLTKAPDWGMTGNYPHPPRHAAAADRAGTYLRAGVTAVRDGLK
jgi:hypothetical protein